MSPWPTVTDPADPRVDDVRDLNSSDSRPDLPGGKGLVVAEGKLVVPRLLESRFPVRCVVGFRSRLEELDAALPGFSDTVPTYEVTRATLAAVAGFDMHRGLVAAADRVPEPDVDAVLDDLPEECTVAVLEGVGDHENIGSLFRNAAGLGVAAVIFGAGCADPLYRRVVRVSMGHVLRVPFAHLGGRPTTWQRGLDRLRERGFTVLAMTPDGDRTLDDAVRDATEAARAAGRPRRIAVMVGAEGPGLTEHAMRAADVRATIPMAPGTDSLNVATAAAVGFYAAARRD
ncbi:RNA methyltransferase [Corynebacterium bovis]|uniref:TrmH family RNA methyltransferase n=1 Tax=Corynebacterium bovis TaxID=36808 RepID=UPI002446EACB|nr:RNA methyltransferase [Corynebacterium bovis]MDH2456264.1 RNA methyltransferase [Corynebacterium bovis]